jgi:hypothetical protein
MNKELKQKWIDALCSGDYPQTQSELCNSGGYCCLGVLCDIVDNTKWSTSDDQVISYDFGYGKCNEFPTYTWLDQVVYLPHYQAQVLATLNDEKDYDFHDIAQWITDNVKETA